MKSMTWKVPGDPCRYRAACSALQSDLSMLLDGAMRIGW
jgi:hypothetical protein